MNVPKAELIVTMSAATTFGLVATDRVTSGHLPTGKFIAASCLAFAGLGMIATFAPEIGAGLSIAVAGTALAHYGLPLANKFGFDTKGK